MSAAKRGATQRATKQKRIRVRMYNVGFGDAFLVTFPTRAGDRRVLIDCGVHGSGPGPRTIKEVAEAIVADLPARRRRIDVVVATHRHADHVSGFQHDLWSEVEVGEVWMPWTEHPKDREARRIREAQSRAAQRLAAAGMSLDAAGRESAAWYQLALNALSNAAAMETLHEGFAGSPTRRFFPEPDDPFPSQYKTAALPGVKTWILGPSRDEDEIRDMDPPGDESFFALARARRGDAAAAPLFDDGWVVDPSAPPAVGYGGLSQDERDALRQRIDDTDIELAAALDKSVNGTSLVLVFEFGDARLLFPGDAQWGTWRRALDDEAARELLGSITFLKVGHHGSHNATPVQFVRDVLPKDIWALVSTRAHTGRWDDIPRLPLLDALREEQRKVLRSDDEDVADPKKGCRRDPDNLWVEVDVDC